MGDQTVEEIRFETYPLVFGEHADPDHVRTVARVAEERGYSGLRFPDHVVLPKHIPDEYPFTETGEYPFDHTDPTYDLFDVLSFVAGVTEEVKLVSNVCAVPFRHPVVLAKNALTLDALSEGRFEFGVGLGWLRTEFEVLDVPYEERASRTDEFLELFDRVCSEGVVEFDGPHHSFQETGFYPQPVEDGGPKLWIGGNSRAAFERLARYGAGWLAPGSVSGTDLASIRDRIDQAWADHDREGEPEISAALPLYDSDGALRDTEALLEDVRASAEAGVTTLNLFFHGDDPERQIEEMETVADEVIDRCQ